MIPKLHSIALTVILLTMSTCLTHAQDVPNENLQTRMVVKQGQDIFVRLRYSGGIKDWDAAFGYHRNIVTTLNDGFITVLDPEGNVMVPQKGKLLNSSVNLRMKDPFDIIVNLAEVYDMSTAGRYVIEWGCKKVRSQMIQIEVIQQLSYDDAENTEPEEQGGEHQPPARSELKFH